MNRFLLGALVMGAVFALTSFALRGGPDPAPTMRTVPWKVSDYPLDRAFRNEFTVLTTPTTLLMPPTGGIILTQIRCVAGGGIVNVAVNGVTETFQFIGASEADHYDLNPPIIVRPGQLFSIVANNTNPVLTLAGYTTLPGET